MISDEARIAAQAAFSSPLHFTSYTIHFTPYTAPLAPPPLCVNPSFYSSSLPFTSSPYRLIASTPNHLYLSAAAPMPLFLHWKRAVLLSTAVARPTRWNIERSTQWIPYSIDPYLPTTGGPTHSSTLGQANYGHTPHSYGQMPQAYLLPNLRIGNLRVVR